MSTFPALFPSFNARNLTAQQVASTFVAPQQFSSLSGQCHSLVVGPRGSGKTTLLKMLQPQALDAWRSQESSAWKEIVSFIGVYVPADISWGMQLATIESERLDPSSVALFGTAAFTTHTLKALIQTIDYVSGRNSGGPNLLSQKAEAEVCRSLSNAWFLADDVRSFISLRLALSQRLMGIKTAASQEARRGPDGRGDRLADLQMLHIPFDEACSLALEHFLARADLPEKRWALMFDELELAPPSVMKTLLDSVRSIDQRFLFKLSLVPYGADSENVENAIKSARVHDDYNTIQLWFSHKEDGYPFCRALWKSVLFEQGREELEAEEVFGRSIFDLGREEWKGEGTRYRSDAKVGRAFASLAIKDPSFAQYVGGKNIDITDLKSIRGEERAETLRKIGALVILRDALLSGSDVQRKRSRKAPDLYTGADALFAMVEGNPRWFKGLVGQMLSKQSPDGKIAPHVQRESIQMASERFRSLLQTIPRNGARIGVLELLDELGDFLHQKQVVDSFDADPVGSFKVDAKTSPEIVQLIGQAINQGAVVRMDDFSSSFEASKLVGKRVRLSYLLAPHYRILLRTGRSVSVSTARARGYQDGLLGFE